MATDSASTGIPLPENWLAHVKSSILHVVSLAHLAIIHTRSWAANSSNARARLRAKLERARNEIALLEEEMRVKDARMALLDAHRRPHYRPTDRLAIVEVKAAREASAPPTSLERSERVARRGRKRPTRLREQVGAA